MKKLLSTILCLAMTFSLATPALAVSFTTASGIKGEIIYQEGGSSLSRSSSSVTVSSVQNQDGSCTIFQYSNGVLQEEHTTVPGSGLVSSKIYNSDGTFSTSQKITRPNTFSAAATARGSTSTRPLGYMHYRNSFTQEIFSINCTVTDEQHINEPFTFYADTAWTLSELIANILSIWAFFANPASLAKQVIDMLSDVGLLEYALNGVISAMITETVRCTYYNQSIRGVPTQPTGRGKEHTLTGTYCFLDVTGSSNIRTEGYTVRDWGNASMGRWMMYNVFGIDNAPTSWTNLD